MKGLTETMKALLLLSLWTFHPMESKFFLNMFSKPPIDAATSKDKWSLLTDRLKNERAFWRGELRNFEDIFQ